MVYEEKKHAKSSWISRSSRGREKKTPWGHEYSWAGFDGMHGKSLYIKKGCRTSLKFHQMKSEMLFVRKGRVEVYYGNELSLNDSVGNAFKTGVLETGDSLMVQSGSPYRLKALEDSEIIEIGNNLSDKPIRIEDDYGRI
jgi:mannose-6-phosphate isomerase-like protein (cupin superfamily)